MKHNTEDIPQYETKVFSSRKNSFCVCIPVINEGQKIRDQIIKMKPLTTKVDIIICDGGSIDGSLDEAFLREQGVSVLLIKRDEGKLSAQLRMGYSYALNRGYKGIITIDGNGKDNVEAIPDFVKTLESGYDLVQGSRFIKGGKAINTPKSRLLAIKLIHAPIISVLAKFRFTDTTNGYRGYSKKYLLDKRVAPFRKIFMNYELLAYLSVRGPQLGLKTIEIPVERKYPYKGKIPTKIKGFSGNLELLKVLLNLGLGKYDPK